MHEETAPTFEVDVSNCPILVHIHGRANFLNCSPLRSFFRKMFDEGLSDFKLDFSDCVGMDSTFLGILAGAAIETSEGDPKGEIQLTGLSDRNLQLVKSLGLHRIVSLVEESDIVDSTAGAKAVGLDNEVQSEAQQKEMLIDAHEELVKIDKSNESKFQDVLTFLKNED